MWQGARLKAVTTIRSATVTLPDGAVERQRRVQVVAGRLLVLDRRTGTTLFDSQIVEGSPGGKRWSLVTEAGRVEVKSGCGCGGSR